MKLDGQTVTAFVNFAPCEPIDGKPCFNIGYATPEHLRRQGRAKEAVEAAIAEMRHGFSRAGIAAILVEAVVGFDNAASQRVAEQKISPTPIQIVDHVSDLPALQYIRSVEARSSN